jgi:hypothetical protein
VTISGLFALCAWQVPKIFATVMTGTPMFGAAEFWAAVSAMVGAAMTTASLAAAGGSAVLGAGNVLVGMTNAIGTTDPATVTSAGSGNVPPPGGGGAGAGGTSGGGSSNESGAVWTGPGSEAWAQAQCAATGSSGDGAAAAPASDAGGDGADSGGSGGAAAPGRSSQAANTQAWRQAGMRARRAGYYAQQTLRALSNDGGGHASGGPPLHIG